MTLRVDEVQVTNAVGRPISEVHNNPVRAEWVSELLQWLNSSETN